MKTRNWIGIGLMLALATSCGKQRHIEELNLDEEFAYVEEVPASYDSNPGDATAEEREALDESEVNEELVDSMPQPPSKEGVRQAMRGIGPLGVEFNDSNHVQLEYAQALGIEPIESMRNAWNLRRPLVEIKSCEEYTVDKLTHSLPFLVPEGADLLKAIGKNFNDTVKAHGGEGYKMIVTSLLRTPATVKSLRRVNRNATQQSTHQFGTTFDITYARFEREGSNNALNDEDLKNLLAKVIYELRREGRCMVKFERKSPCFHITATR